MARPLLQGPPPGAHPWACSPHHTPSPAAQPPSGPAAGFGALGHGVSQALGPESREGGKPCWGGGTPKELVMGALMTQ